MEAHFSLCDGRDLYEEIMGVESWRQDLPIYKMILLFPDFIEDMLINARKNVHLVYGKFHLGQLYDLKSL